MNAREAIAVLIGKYGEELRVTQSWVAKKADINNGQFSAWLRNDSALSPEKQGLAAQVVLALIESPLAQTIAPLKQAGLKNLAEVLRIFGPLRQLQAADPRQALDGKAISPDNPHYVRRYADDELEDRLGIELVQLAIFGGSKSGRSSLLLAAQRKLEPSRLAVTVDFSDYRPESHLSPQQTEAKFCEWFADRCESQVSGLFVHVLNCSVKAESWVMANILPNAPGNGCVFLLDNVETLPFQENRAAATPQPREAEILDKMIYYWLSGRHQTGLLNRLGIIVTANPHWKGLSPSWGFERLDKIHLDSLGPRTTPTGGHLRKTPQSNALA